MNELDLHGFTHDEAEFAAEDFVLIQSQNPMFECRIIVGNSSHMAKRVTKMLDKHGFKYYIPSWNVGEVIVSN
jgi:DNA-nicking Smr family endonuclease